MQQTPDVTIIGAGIVGLSTAISIRTKFPEATVTIFEKGSSARGASTKNAGFACFGSVSELMMDIDSMGVEKTMEIVSMRLNGFKILKSRCGTESLDYQQSGGVELFRKDDKKLKEMCFNNIDTLNTMIQEFHGVKNVFKLSNHRYPGYFDPTSVFNPYEGVLDPVKMIMTLHRMCMRLDVRIFYGVDIEKIVPSYDQFITRDKIEVRYRRLVICTNGFSLKLFSDIPLVPARNQVLITKPVNTSLPYSGFHMDRGYIYFRRIGDRILLGGGRHIDMENETTSEAGVTEKIQSHLQKILEDIQPGASENIDMWWSGILGVGPEKSPIIEKMSDNITLGVRLGGMGVAIGSWMGDVLADKTMSH